MVSEKSAVLCRLRRLRSAVGVRGSGVESEEKRIAQRSRSETAAAELQTEAHGSCRPREIAARDERAGLRSVTGVVEKGIGPTDSLWSGANPRVGPGVEPSVYAERLARDIMRQFV